MVSTRADRNMVDIVSKALVDLSKIKRREKRIQMIEHLFNNILLTSKGITFINKHKEIGNVIRNKLEEFYNEPEVKEHTIKWHMEIFNEPIRQGQNEEDDENEEDTEDTEDTEDDEETHLINPENESLCKEWIKHITKSAKITRNRLLFLDNIWGILHDIDEAQTMYNAVSYNRELYETLITEYGQTMLKQFPVLSNMLKTEINYQYVDGRIVEWGSKNWWNNVFNNE